MGDISFQFERSHWNGQKKASDTGDPSAARREGAYCCVTDLNQSASVLVSVWTVSIMKSRMSSAI